MTDYDEPEDFKLCDIYYRATKEQHNAIWSELVTLSEWQDFETINTMLRYQREGNIQSGDFKCLCEERTDGVVKLAPIIQRLINKHTR